MTSVYQFQEYSKLFTRSEQLKIQMRVHANLRPHTCDVCPRVHMRIHTGVYNYV